MGSFVGRALAISTTAVVTTACPLPRAGDPGDRVFELSVQIEDDTNGGVAFAEWATPQGPVAVVTERLTEFERDFFAVYEEPPDNAFVGGVARLDAYYGDYEDFENRDNDDEPLARTRIAVTRTTVWFSEGRWRDVDADAVPFDIDDEAEVDADFFDFDRSAVFFIDSAIPAARRCGDDVQATCDLDCDIVTGVGAAACCADAHDALIACGALVVNDEGTARLQRPLR